jgi:hypothetical protein
MGGSGGRRRRIIRLPFSLAFVVLACARYFRLRSPFSPALAVLPAQANFECTCPFSPALAVCDSKPALAFSQAGPQLGRTPPPGQVIKLGLYGRGA